VSAGKIDDGEPPHTQTRAIGDVDTLVIRATVHNLVVHVAHESFGNVALPRRADNSGDPAHGLFYPFTATAIGPAFFRCDR